jgi:hypothetical protein
MTENQPGTVPYFKISSIPAENQIHTEILNTLRSIGIVVFACRGTTLDEWTSTIVSVLQPVATQIEIFTHLPLWRNIGVNLEKEVDRSEGTGESPLHMDFVNAEKPPDYVVLLCIRDDPLGGGASTLASIADATSALSPAERHILEQSIFIDGKVVDLNNVGSDINPFAVFDPDSPYPYRYTSQLLKQPLPFDANAALRRLQTELERRRLTFRLSPGQALIIDQHRYVHGKLSLGDGQSTIPPDSHRLLLHGFFRT